MQETNTIDLEEYVNEPNNEEPNLENKKQNSFDKFIEWAENIEQGRITDDQIASLKQAISELPGGKLELGPEGQTAFQFFSQFGLEDSDLEMKLKQAYSLDSSVDALEIMKLWAQDNYPEILVSLGISGTTPTEPEQPVAEAKGADAMIQEVAKIVKSFYNRDNPNVGPFRGEEGIAIDVEKKISEKFGEKAGQQARMMAEKYMQKLTQEWSMRHKGNQLMGEKGAAEGMDEKPDEGNAYGQAVQNTPQGQEIKINGKPTGDIKREDDETLEAMSRHAKGWEKYGPGMKELAKAGKAGASEKEMDRLRKKHNRYDEEVDLIRKLAGMAK